MGLRDLFKRKAKGGLPSKIYIGSLIKMRDFKGWPANYSPYGENAEDKLTKVKGGLFTVESGFNGGFVLQRYSPKKSGMINHSGIVNHLHTPDEHNIEDCNLEERYTLTGYGNTKYWVTSFVGVVKDVSKGILPKGTLLKVNPEYIKWWRKIRYGSDILRRDNFSIAWGLIGIHDFEEGGDEGGRGFSNEIEQTDAWNHFVNLYWGADSHTMDWLDFLDCIPYLNEDGNKLTLMFRHEWELGPANLLEGGMWNKSHRYGSVFPSFYTYDSKRANKIFKKFLPKITMNDSSQEHFTNDWVIGSSCQVWGGNESIGLIPYISLKKDKESDNYEVYLEGGPQMQPSSSEQLILPLKKNRKPYIKDKSAVITALSPYALGWLVKMKIFEVVGYDLSVAKNALKGNRYYDPDMATTSAYVKTIQASDENIQLVLQVRENNFEGLYAPLRPHDIVDFKDLPVLKVVKITP